MIPDTDLHSLPMRRLYCGPTALCVITGRSYEHVIRPALNKVKRRRLNQGVMGVTNKQMEVTLRYLGWRAVLIATSMRNACEVIDRKFRLSEMQAEALAAGEVEIDSIMLVNVTSHFVVMQNNVVVDNRAIAPLAMHPSRRQAVRRAYRIIKGGGWPQ